MSDATTKEEQPIYKRLLTRQRHIAVFEWLLEEYNCTEEALISRLLIDAVTRRQNDHREAKGGGGMTTRNIERLK